MTDLLLWGRELQVVCDVLRSGGSRRATSAPARRPRRAKRAFVFFPRGLSTPRSTRARFGSGAFLTALDATFAELAGSALAKVDYGKPHASSTTSPSSARAGGLHRVFMVGDNPLTDIAGAKRAGDPWSSILVESGMWRPGDDTGGATRSSRTSPRPSTSVLAFERG
ncbi:hypothetical protein JL722_14433 [Aureococcus anophagefferens]|nr:hypothetical protein JL722_14433 [Aureococcus anophagefferens]